MNGLSGAYPRNFSNFTHNDEHDTILSKYHLSNNDPSRDETMLSR